jgi:hypothetical protein
MKNFKRFVAAFALTVLLNTACDSLTEVSNPDIIEAEGVDPTADAATFSLSALQNLYDALGTWIRLTAWLTNEARVGDTFPTLNEFGRRIVIDANTNLSGDVWNPLARGITFAEVVQDLLADAPEPATNVNVARSAFASGVFMVLMGETFCEGVINVSAPITPTAMMDSAIIRLNRVVAIGEASPASATEAKNLANAAHVFLARAHLFKGDDARAVAEAALVPAGFVFNAPYVDDASNRGRLGNDIYAFSAGGTREGLVVGPEWRAFADAGDSRIKYTDAGRFAQDGVLRLFSQTKYPGWNASIRLASKLEADYLAAEAQGTGAMLTLLQARRTAAGLSSFAGTAEAEIRREFFLQKHLDFWLEGKRMGDWIRNPNDISFILQPGSNYYKPELGPVGNQTCLPVTIGEKENNPNWPNP